MNETKLVVKDLEMVFDGKCALSKVSFDVRMGNFSPSWALRGAERPPSCGS